jgi:L-fuculose-phosphate aldolase
MNYQSAREQVYAATMQAVEYGLIYLSAGNISLRLDENTVAMTPSAIKYDQLRPQDIAIITLEGQVIDGEHRPSSETPMHTHILKHMPDVKAICHTHSPFAITFATLGRSIPVFCLEMVYCGGEIPVANWACPGTDAPGHEALRLLEANPGLKVVLLRNHGLIATGNSLTDAIETAFNAETAMKIYHQALQIGEPAPLTPEQLAEIHSVYY